MTPHYYQLHKEQKRGEDINNKIDIPAELQSIMKLKVYVTIHAQDQFTKLIRLPAEPLTFMGNI